MTYMMVMDNKEPSDPIGHAARVGFVFGMIFGGIVMFLGCLLLAGFLHWKPS